LLTVAAGMKNPACGRRTFEQIIVGVDGSEPAQAALETVFALPAEDLRQVFFYTVAGDNAVEYEHAERIIGKAVAEAQERGVAVKGIVLAGRPNDVLVAAAKQRDADLIVLGSHGRRGLRRLFLGSVAEDVVRHSAVPVLVVRSRSRTAAAGKAVTVEAREPQAAVR
jgi:nucleotide-binding universal stress UspA family protein